jgi:hypothetical protein
MKRATKGLALAVAALSLIAAPAFANTLDEIIAHGDTVDVGGMSYELTYKADGTFTAGDFAGTYKVDGNKLCLTIPGVLDNQCTVYPDGKKSGDKFTIPGDQGESTVTIH